MAQHLVIFVALRYFILKTIYYHAIRLCFTDSLEREVLDAQNSAQADKLTHQVRVQREQLGRYRLYG